MAVINQKRRSMVRTLRPWLFGFAGAVALGWFFHFLTTLGPRRAGALDTTVEMTGIKNPAMAKLSDEIGALELQYRKADEANLVTPEAIDKLAQAFDKQRALLRLYPNVGRDQLSRLTRLDTELGNARAKAQTVEIDRLDKDGADAVENADFDLAMTKFSEALRLQREINASSASSRYKNYVRETSFAQQIEKLSAAPLDRDRKAFTAAGRKAAEEMRWTDALSAYKKAREIQDRINRDYSRTIYADLSVVDALDSEIESLNAAGTAAEIDAKEKAGDEANAEGRPLAAAAYFAAAGDIQLQLNQKFPKSHFVSSERIESLEVKRQTALSSLTADTVASLDAEIAEHLRKRQVVMACQKIGEEVVLIDKLFADYPKSKRIDGALKIKMAYLALRRPALRALQDAVYDGLLPMPGASDRLLLKTEVSQSLYLLVMTANPSRNPGREFPVDSVSWDDAREFCTRLSWLLSMTVRLPTMDEYRVALGDGQSSIWSLANSGGHSQETGKSGPNREGFYDLVGNLAEWTGTSVDDNTAMVFGGSYLDGLEQLKKIPSEARPKSDRARHVGFRVIVELPSP